MPAPRQASIVCRAELVYSGAGDLMADVADLQTILGVRKGSETFQRKQDKLHSYLRTIDCKIVSARLLLATMKAMTATELEI